MASNKQFNSDADMCSDAFNRLVDLFIDSGMSKDEAVTCVLSQIMCVAADKAGIDPGDMKPLVALCSQSLKLIDASMALEELIGKDRTLS